MDCRVKPGNDGGYSPACSLRIGAVKSSGRAGTATSPSSTTPSETGRGRGCHGGGGPGTVLGVTPYLAALNRRYHRKKKMKKLKAKQSPSKIMNTIGEQP